MNVVEADGNADLWVTESGQPDYGSGSDLFSSSTTNSLDSPPLLSGAASNVVLNNISAAASTMTLDITIN